MTGRIELIELSFAYEKYPIQTRDKDNLVFYTILNITTGVINSKVNVT